MPSYISKGGVWEPAKEHVVLPHLTGTKDEVYDGPDRAALHELALANGVDADGKPKVGTLGIHYKNDAELLMRAKSLGYSTVAEFAAAQGYSKTPEQEAVEIKEKEKTVITHTPPKRGEANQKLGGGTDTSGGGNDKLGGFGADPDGFGKR